MHSLLHGYKAYFLWANAPGCQKTFGLAQRLGNTHQIYYFGVQDDIIPVRIVREMLRLITIGEYMAMAGVNYEKQKSHKTAVQSLRTAGCFVQAAGLIGGIVGGVFGAFLFRGWMLSQERIIAPPWALFLMAMLAGYMVFLAVVYGSLIIADALQRRSEKIRSRF